MNVPEEMVNLSKAIGLDAEGQPVSPPRPYQFINLNLAAMGLPVVASQEDAEFHEMVGAMLSHHRETGRLLAGYLCPADQRIQSFLDEYLRDLGQAPRLPAVTFVLDRHGIARALSLPAESDSYEAPLLTSYRLRQGVLHNPRSDRRTTQGIFHVAEGGFAIPSDKRAVPRQTFKRLLERALKPPKEAMELPVTAGQANRARCFVSLLLRPVVCPEVPGFCAEKRMEVRFFAPGTLVSNLDFVESIFGNAGDPYLPENDAGLDVHHWTGHTGCVILAPHLVRVTKKEAGLPHWDEATDRQRKDGMCWRDESEFYNDGAAFKLTCRDARGVILTLIADNYFGYCKKEVKTQISYSANLYGSCEEEHAGGAIAYASYDLGEAFSGNLHVKRMEHSFEEVARRYRELMDLRPEGYGIDLRHPNIIYVPEDVHFDLPNQTLSWPHAGGTQSLRLRPGHTYVRPSGYKLHMEKTSGRRAWRLVGSVAEGVVCHKPCTVSGGGKSEISKPITDAVLHGPVFVSDFQKDFDFVEDLLERDYSDRFRDKSKTDQRPILSAERSLGSVIKLLTPATRDYTDPYNTWLASIPQYIRELVFVVKRFFKPEWELRWRDHFSVDIIDGTPAKELKCDNRKLIANYLRVGFAPDGSWRVFGLRQDFHPAQKWQMEDDITASVVVPASALPGVETAYSNPSLKFVRNCEYRLFQRPDDAIHRGYDKLTERELSQPGNFLSNFEPLTRQQAGELMEDTIGFDQYSEPMQGLIRGAHENGPAFFVSSAHPRLVGGKPSKNPRYLQTRPDLLRTRERYLLEVAARLHRRIPVGEPVHTPVSAVLPGRRNNPPDAANQIRPLAVYNPIHYMELPELFMEFISSMTGKSPSTTGAGSEGALTKGPFNALPPVIDLNNALTGYLLTGYQGFITAAGHLGPHCRIDHDISLLIPEIWCRMTREERTPEFLIAHGYLERCEDWTFEGCLVRSSRLGWRITRQFVRSFFGRIFHHPQAVITDEMLRPEVQSPSVFADGMDNIVGTHQRVAAQYFEDGSVEMACPPLKALLHIMAHGHFEGKDLADPEVRALFTREKMLGSEWYEARLKTKQEADVRLWQRHVKYLEAFLTKTGYEEEAERLGVEQRLAMARKTLNAARAREYIEGLKGTLGADPAGKRPGEFDPKT